MGGFFSITSWNDVDVVTDTAPVAPTASPAGNNKVKPTNAPANVTKSNKSNTSSDPKSPDASNNKPKKGRVARRTYKKRRG